MAKARKALLAPSILSADFARLGEEVRAVEQAGADWIHVDVMDGHFVPNLTIGPLVVEALKPITQLPLDCHLMVSRPQEWIEPFAKAGAGMITVHAEVAPHLDRLVQHIRSLGCKAGVSINPATPLSALDEILPSLDLVLVMSVNPGFGGQKFIESSRDKIKKLAAKREALGAGFVIEIDGGVGASNIGELYKLGCDAFVAGSSVFSGKDRAANIQGLRKALASAGAP
ncbi:MAG TPA: ribulose-phosphate 3-epimerase [Bdellovibrionota bacterium]|jgi:ribulose-phosphate 3-epimerase|nr:ribulose-phosphate 3-epimerase [Bdellovibrionota bacterium]